MTKIQKRNRRTEQGQALLIALIFLLAVTFLGMGLIMLSSIDIHTSRNLRLAEKAMNSAEEGVMVGMAFASDARSGFLSLGQGEGIIIKSYDPGMPADGLHFNLGASNREEHQYEVEVTMAGNAPIPPGETVGVGGSQVMVIYRQIRIRSTGYVLEEAGKAFNPNRPPNVHRRIEVLARIRFQA